MLESMLAGLLWRDGTVLTSYRSSSAVGTTLRTRDPRGTKRRARFPAPFEVRLGGCLAAAGDDLAVGARPAERVLELEGRVAVGTRLDAVRRGGGRGGDADVGAQTG